MDPICSILDWKLDALSEYEELFVKWQDEKCFGLTRETFSAIIMSLSGIRKLATYLIECAGFSYVLTGKINSDPIEARFGRYRQMSGGNYLISVKNVLENERKLKILSFLRQTGFNFNDFENSNPNHSAISHEDAYFFLSK